MPKEHLSPEEKLQKRKERLMEIQRLKRKAEKSSIKDPQERMIESIRQIKKNLEQRGPLKESPPPLSPKAEKKIQKFLASLKNP